MPPQDPNNPTGRQPVMDIQPAPLPANPSGKDIPTLPADMTMAKTKRHIPLLPILIAVVVAIAFIGLAAFAFIESKHTKKPQQTQSGQTKTDQKNRVSGDDVDKVKNGIDQNMNSINDSTDFTVDDLSKQKMGGL